MGWDGVGVGWDGTWWDGKRVAFSCSGPPVCFQACERRMARLEAELRVLKQPGSLKHHGVRLTRLLLLQVCKTSSASPTLT